MASPHHNPTSSQSSSRNVPIANTSRRLSSTATAVTGSFAGTPPLPQIPARTPGSFQARSNMDRSGTTTTPDPSAPQRPLSGLGDKTAPGTRSTDSALTAALGSSASASGTAELPDNLGSGAVTPVRPDDSAFSNLADIPDEEKARVLRRHLVSAGERGTNTKSSSKGGTPALASRDSDNGEQGTEPAGAADDSVFSSTSGAQEDETFPIPYDAPGGDVTHDLYKWQHDHRPRPGRSASFSHADRSGIVDPQVQQMKEPGGFRRNFVTSRAQERGLDRPPMLRNVIDFLYLYGHFAGEDLDEDEDIDDDEDEDLDNAEEGQGSRQGQMSRDATERTPLLRSRSRPRHHRRTISGPGNGTASLTQAVLMLLKGFVGTGVLFMGKAFFNGGIIFSTIVLLLIAAISLWSFMLLVEAYMKVPGSFGDIGGALYGPYMRLTILTSIAISQIGFVAAYTIFIAENLQAFVLAVTDCKTFIETHVLIFAQLLLFLPLAMIRNLAKLSGTALVADAFILVGLVYIASCEIGTIAEKGVADVVGFNRDNFPLLIGTAVFAFEGIGLVIPITESMKEPEKFPRALTGVMITVAVLFSAFGVLGYAAYGSDVQTVVLVNLPQEEKFVQASQFLYSIAILLSIPLQLFPAVRIMETGLFSRSGKYNSRVKWQKNIFRACTVVGCSLISWAGSSELDKFVSLIGAFACIPLCFIYPPMLHLRACAHTRKAKVLDCTLLAFGIAVGVYTTIQTIRSLFSTGNGDSPKFGHCEVPTAR